MKLRRRLILYLMVLIVISIMILSLIFIIQGKVVLEERTKAQLLSVTILKENSINNFIETEITNLKDISTSNIIKENLNIFLKSQNNTYKINVRNRLNEYLLNNPSFSELFFLDLNGKVITSTDKNQEGKIKDLSDWVIKGKKDIFVSDFYYDLLLQKPALIILFPYQSNKKNISFILVGKINIQKISDIMTERAGLGETGETYLVNKFNYVITDLRFNQKAQLKKTIYSDAIKDCLKGNNGHLYYKNYRDVSVVGTYIWKPELNICLLTEMNQEEAFFHFNELKKIIIFYSILISFITIIFIVFLSSSITKPLVKLRNVSKKIGEGNLDIKIKIKSKDEIEDLANSFNQMVVNLKKSQSKLKEHEHDLEKQVEKRTKELQLKLDELEKFKKLTVGRELRMIELKKQIKDLKKKKKK